MAAASAESIKDYLAQRGVMPMYPFNEGPALATLRLIGFALGLFGLTVATIALAKVL